ncbi:MAG: G/U mismatch-specific DNA glycosylase [Actinomycetota bacterium]|nr:G/U mismatch-specific DNA glycosylase [Actinomycetota bacterium]
MAAATDEPGPPELPDLFGPRVDLVLCGTNPGLLSARLGQHFARPGNRFWPVLHAAGFTDRVLRPSEQALLAELGIGLTNLVRRSSTRASELSPEELRAGASALEERVAAHRPPHVAVLGVQAYRVAFGRPRAAVGRQEELIAGAALWVLPNPSGLQAHYQLPDLAALYGELRRAVGIGRGPGPGPGPLRAARGGRPVSPGSGTPG